jgi:NTP pyrophosphatase (non-canonical NTP hydrolase)
VEVREFQQWMEERYGDRDRERGLSRTFAWFVEEVGELSRALHRGDEAQVKHEFSDVFAWLLSLANLAGIDAEEALQRYAQGCPKCGASPCACAMDR